MNTVKIDPKVRYRLSPYLFMQFAEPLGTADSSIDAAWDFVNDCWRPKTLEILKKLAPPMIRWGGCFSSYYHWREAVGPQSQRIPMLNLCWDGIYLNRVGTAEIAEIAQTLHSELLLCVNFESDGRKKWIFPRPEDNRFGSAEEAADWVRYCNDPDDRLRRSHGFHEPFNVRYWQIGNETSYWKENGFSSVENVHAASRFIRAMRQADPDLKLIVWGDGPNDEWQDRFREGKTCSWARDICEAVGDTAEMVAFHNHFGGGPEYAALHGTAYRNDPDVTWERLFASTRDFEDRILYMRESVAPYGRKLAITEAHLVLSGRHRGDILSSWGAGVAYARCANILQRHGDIVEIATLADLMGNRWQNNAVMLPTPEFIASPYFQPVGSIMALYAAHIGRDAVHVSAPDGIDAAASRTGDKLFLHLVNMDRTAAKRINFQIPGFSETPERILEIAAAPETEITEMTPELFAPHEVSPADGTYTLPGAGVSVMEFTATERSIS